MPPRVTRIYSWNVNGLRSCAEKGFLSWLANAKADVVGLQETRATPEQLPEDLRQPKRVHTYFASAERLGYSGVALYARRPFDAVETSLGVPEFDAEGRDLERTIQRLIQEHSAGEDTLPPSRGPGRP